MSRHDTGHPVPSGPLTTLAFDGAAISGRDPGLPEGTPLALLIEGDLAAHASSGPDGAIRIPVPEAALAGMIDVLDGRTGRSLLPAPIPFQRTVEWLGWAASRLDVAGAFRIPHVAAPVLVQCYAEDRLLLQALAIHDGERHRFSGPLRALPEPGLAWTLRPCLNRLELDHPLSVGATETGLAGRLAHQGAARAIGFLSGSTPDEPGPNVELRLDGIPFATVTPGTAPPETPPPGATPATLFMAPFPPGTPTNTDLTVSAVIAETGTELFGSPYLLRGLPRTYEGVLDVVADGRAQGWVYDKADLAHTVMLEAVLDQDVVGTARADRQRDDLTTAGLPRTDCAFAIPLDAPPERLAGRAVTVRIAGTNTQIAGSPMIYRA